MSKTKVKFLIIVLGFLIALCLFNTNTVNAATTEEIQAMLDLVPDEMYLDISEIEYEKANDLIKEQVEKIWEDNGINIANYQYECYQKMYSEEWFYVGRIIVSGKEKEIKLIFNNTDNFNSEDEQYVKNLNFENPRYLEVNLDYLTKYKNNSDELWNWFDSYIEDYYNKKVNNNSVKVKVHVGVGYIEGLNMGSAEGRLYLNIFRNEKLYDVVSIDMTLTPVINVTKVETNVNLKEEVVNEVKNIILNMQVTLQM